MASSLSHPDFNLMFLPPDSWVEIAVDPARRSVQVAALMKTVQKVFPNTGNSYAALSRSVEAMFAEAWGAGVRYAIMPRIRVDGTINMLAFFTVAVIPAASPDGDTDTQRNEIYRSLVKEREQFLDGEFSEITTAENTSLGKGVQAASVEYMQTKKGKDISRKISLFRAFFPVMDQTIVATGTCFQEEYRDILFRMFGLMASTLSVEPAERGGKNSDE